MSIWWFNPVTSIRNWAYDVMTDLWSLSCVLELDDKLATRFGRSARRIEYNTTTREHSQYCYISTTGIDVLIWFSSFCLCVSHDLILFGFQSKMLGKTCSMTTVTKSSEVHQQAELICRQRTAYETSTGFVSYGFPQISILSGWGWRDTFSLDRMFWPDT